MTLYVSASDLTMTFGASLAPIGDRGRKSVAGPPVPAAAGLAISMRPIRKGLIE